MKQRGCENNENNRKYGTRMIILDPGRDLEASDLWPFLLQKGSDKRGFLVDSSTGTFDLKWAFAKRYSNIISTITGTVISTWSSCRELIGLLMVCFPSWVCISVHFWLSLRSQPSLVVQVQDLFSQAKKWGHHVSLLTSCLPVPNTLDLDWTGAFWGWWTLGYSMVFRFDKILRPQVLGHTHQVQLHDKSVSGRHKQQKLGIWTCILRHQMTAHDTQ